MSLVKVFLPEGGFKTVPINQQTVAKELIAIVAEKLEILRLQPFLALVSRKDPFLPAFLAPDENVMAGMARLEVDCLELRLIFNMQPQAMPQTESELDFEFRQAKMLIGRGYWAVDLNHALYLGGLALQENQRDFRPTYHTIDFVKRYLETPPDEVSLLPPHLMTAKPITEICEMILRWHAQHAGKSVHKAKFDYLESCKRLPHYGMVVFSVIYLAQGEKQLKESCCLGISNRGLHALDEVTHREIGFWSYGDILSWGASENCFTFTSNEQENGMNRHIFRSNNAQHIASTTNSFVQLIIKHMQIIEERRHAQRKKEWERIKAKENIH